MSTDPCFDGLSNLQPQKRGKPGASRKLPNKFTGQAQTPFLAAPQKQLLDLSRLLVTRQSAEQILYKTVQGILRSIPQVSCCFRIRETETRLLSNLEAVQKRTGKGLVVVVRVKKGTDDGPAAGNDVDTLAVPVQIGDKRVGTLTIYRKSGTGFSDEESKLAQIFINAACLAFENEFLQAEARIHRQFMTRVVPFTETLNRPFKIGEVTEAIGRGALALSGADRVAIYGRDPVDQITHAWTDGISSGALSKVLAGITSDLDETSDAAMHSLFVHDIRSLPEDSLWRRFCEVEGIAALAVCPIVYEGQKTASVDCFFDRPHAWSPAEVEALELYARQASVALENTRLCEELEESYLQTVLTMARMLDVRDAYTARHSRRLTAWAEGTARRLNCTPEEIKLIRWAAMLHDIGKIGIPDSILQKAGPLTDDEWAVMKRHPELGAEIIAPVKKLRLVTPIIRAHQEKYDGSGYPDGLAGEQIPLAARILTVVDAFGAMTDDRVFRKARTQAEAVAELKRCAGKHFDRKVVQVFFEVINANPLVN